MKLVLDLPDWQAELLRRAVNVYTEDSGTPGVLPMGIHAIRLAVANAILDAPRGVWSDGDATEPKFPVITGAQIRRLDEIQRELADLAEQKKAIEAEIIKHDKKVLVEALAKRRGTFGKPVGGHAMDWHADHGGGDPIFDDTMPGS